MTFRISRKVLSLVAAAVAALAVVIAVTACSSGGGGNATENAAANAGSALLEQNQPPPVFPTSAYRAEIIEIEAIEALGAPTTSMFFPMGTTVVVTGKGPKFSSPPMKTCPSEGVPIPNTVSLTNPQQVVTQDNKGNGITGSAVISQIDPNGGYVAGSSSGTYVLCDTPSGGTKFNYWEGPVWAESGDALWSDTDGIVDVGPSQLPVCTVVTSNGADGSGLQDGDRYYHCVEAPGARKGSGLSQVNSAPISTPSPSGTKASYTPAS